MKYFYFLWSVVLFFSCIGKTQVSKKNATYFISTSSASDVKQSINPCPDFNLDIYHNRWVKLSRLCYVSNRIADSVFVINNKQIDFGEFIKQTKPLKLKNLNTIEKNLYLGNYPVIFFTEKLTGEWQQDLYYEDAEIFGYMSTPDINYIIFRCYGACMGHFTNIISINKNNELIDHKMLTGNFSGKYGDGPNYELKQVNDSVYNQIYEITTCRGWDDQVKKDSLFREYYSRTRITLSHTGHFLEEPLETDSSLQFLKMLNICGPE